MGALEAGLGHRTEEPVAPLEVVLGGVASLGHLRGVARDEGDLVAERSGPTSASASPEVTARMHRSMTTTRQDANREVKGTRAAGTHSWIPLPAMSATAMATPGMFAGPHGRRPQVGIAS